MPVKSKAQSRLMHGVCSGSIKKPGLSKKVACEYVGHGHSTKNLPERKKKKGK